MYKFKEKESLNDEGQVVQLKNKIKELEKRLLAKDAEIARIKEQNRRLIEEKSSIEMRYRGVDDHADKYVTGHYFTSANLANF